MHNSTICAAAGFLSCCAILTSTIATAQATPVTTTPGTGDGFLRTAPAVPVHHRQYIPGTTSTPYYATFLKPVRGATVTNVTVENVCKPGEILDHNKLTTNQAIQMLVLRALQDKKVTYFGTQWL